MPSITPLVPIRWGSRHSGYSLYDTSIRCHQVTIEERYRERYKSGDTPWDLGQPDFNLIEVVTKKPILSCKALDIGCGTGDNSIWLAQNRFQVIGTDTSDIALEQAKEKASKANVECDFVLVDFLRNKIEGAPFGFVFDRGCFHSFSSEKQNAGGATKASPGGRFGSLATLFVAGAGDCGLD